MLEAAHERVLEAATVNPEAEKAEKTTTSKRRGKEKEVMKAIPQTLTIQQKTTLIQQVLDEQKKNLSRLQEEANRMLFGLQVELDAQDETMSIIHLETIALRQAFARYENADGTRNAPPPQKIISYLEEQLRRKDGELDKLLTKHQGLKSRVAKQSLEAADIKMKEEGVVQFRAGCKEDAIKKSNSTVSAEQTRL